MRLWLMAKTPDQNLSGVFLLFERSLAYQPFIS